MSTVHVILTEDRWGAFLLLKTVLIASIICQLIIYYYLITSELNLKVGCGWGVGGVWGVRTAYLLLSLYVFGVLSLYVFGVNACTI